MARLEPEESLLEEYRDTLRSPRLPSRYSWRVRQWAALLRSLWTRVFGSDP